MWLATTGSPDIGCSSLCSCISAGPIAFWPRSRRPHHSLHAVDADAEEMIIRLRKKLVRQGLDAGARTIRAQLARRKPPESGRPVPAVATIWRILSPARLCQSTTAETVPVKLAHVLR
jgi:hypothetical protein